MRQKISNVMVLGLGAICGFLAFGHGCTRVVGSLTQGSDTGHGPGPNVTQVAQQAALDRLDQFHGENDLRQYMRQLAAAHERDMAREENRFSLALPSPTLSAAESDSEASGSGESITNVQEAGVDEGGIVKVHGDHLVVLRRGRLFTIRIGDDELRPVSVTNAFPAGSRAQGWYDEMLIHDDTIVVVGFNYGESATEIGLFDIDQAGGLGHRRTFYLRSNDYYSSRNYASRLLGDTLIFYMPYSLSTRGFGGEGQGPAWADVLPAVRPHRAGQSSSSESSWSPIIQAAQIYRPVQQAPYPVLHTVVRCDLAAPELQCTAQGVIGPRGRSFYVSPTAVYLWVHGTLSESFSNGAAQGPANAVLYRLPLTDTAPGAMRVTGAPTDQLSFKESSDEHLNVLLQAQGDGEGMWGAELGSSGDVALLRVPVGSIDRTVPLAGANSYVPLPRPAGNGSAFHNRFVGDHVLYGNGSGWGHASRGANEGEVYVYPYRRRASASRLPLPHGVDRVEVMGRAAVVIGTDGRNLHFSALDLSAQPRVAGSFVQQNASQGELRSHGFFYRPQSETQGLLGLPIRHGSSPGHRHLVDGSAEVLYLRVAGFDFSRLGTLASGAAGAVEDHCVASCVDWYGNARPIFLRGRVFALLGYELVEGRAQGNQITEVRRANFYRAMSKS